MANLQERRDKSGKLISYSIRVHRGRGADGKQLKPWTATFEVSPTWTEKSARINIPRPSRGYFLCGRSPMLPATPHAALVRLAICINFHLRYWLLNNGCFRT